MSGTDTHQPQQIGDLLNAGFAALAQGGWGEGWRCFESVLEYGELPEALEGLGMAAYWLDDVPAVFESRERAYLLYRERGDRRAAARVALMVGDDYMVFRKEEAISNGWMQRARRLLEGLEPSLEHGMLAGFEGFFALQVRHDIAEAKRASATALALAQALGSADLEVGALSIQGLALVYEGQVSEGMRLLDEATTAALAGEVHSPDMIMAACCYMIYACERVRDFDRSAQWCEKVREFCLRYNLRSLLAFCRTHYAAVLIWRGAWAEAEAELMTAKSELAATRIGMATESILRLAELRRRQGRPDEASRLFADVPGDAFAVLGRAALAFDAGDALAASDLVERGLRQLPSEDRLERVDGLELALRVYCALERLDLARETLAELESSISPIGTPPLRGVVAAGRGILAAAEGDLDAARRCFEDAVDLFGRSGAPYETSRARIELARALAALGRPAVAVAEAQQALEVFSSIGAAPDVARAAALLREFGAERPPDGAAHPASAGLTRREAEVLGLLARGLSNQEIARDLYLSVRTVERHISTIYAKIGADGPAARAIASAFAFSHGLAPASTS